MRTAKEMAEWTQNNNTGSGFSKKSRLKHFQVVEKQLQQDEEVKGTFCGIHNYKSMTDNLGNFAYAITNKRIICGQKKLMGENVQIISRKHLNDVTKSTGMMFGTITFDTFKEVFNVHVDKKEADKIHELITHQLFEDEPVKVTESSKDDLASQLVKLKELVDQGILTEAEFEAKKSQLLGL